MEDKKNESHLLEFYGEECPYCRAMDHLVDRLEEEEGVTVTRYEVWHDPGNARKMEDYDVDLCGGVPFFCNTSSGGWICGLSSYEELKAWAAGRAVSGH